MEYLLGKLLQPLLWPLTWAIGASVAAAVFAWRERARAAALSAAVAAITLLLPSLAVFSDLLCRYLENYFPSSPIEDYPAADMIVVLSGSTGLTLGQSHEPEEVSGSRLLPAARLYRAGKAPLVLVSGGVYYTGSDGKPRADSDDMRDLLVELGVPPEKVLVDRSSRNTRENAIHSLDLARRHGARTLLLVTSAIHQRRAHRMFAHPDIRVIPVPTDRQVPVPRGGIQAWLPDIRILARSTQTLKEYAGYLVTGISSGPAASTAGVGR